MVSGFFLEKKYNKIGNISAIEGSFKRIISLQIIGSLIYLPFWIQENGFRFPLQILLCGTYAHLWFLSALIVGYMLCWYILQWKSRFLLLTFSILIILSFIVTSSYDIILFHRDISIAIPRFLSGAGFMLIGYSISQHASWIDNHKKAIISIVALSGIMTFIEGAWAIRTKNENELLFSTSIFAISLFGLTTVVQCKESFLSQCGAKYAFLIYLLHPLFIYLLHPFFIYLAEKSNLTTLYNLQFILPLALFLTCLTFSITLEKFLPRIFKMVNGDFTAFCKL